MVIRMRLWCTVSTWHRKSYSAYDKQVLESTDVRVIKVSIVWLVCVKTEKKVLHTAFKINFVMSRVE